MEYRKEIDGLRAIAVIPVIFFHAGFNFFKGGFVGVDIFFVISGYLITTIIISDLEKGEFSIVGFYERRARRILPALFFVMFACLPFAWFWLLLSDMKDFAQSLIVVPLFASNILFFLESNYFDTASEFKPLLHTWSLAVEEQYYVLFPFFLKWLFGFGRKRTLQLLFLVLTISLLLANWAVSVEPVGAFYLLPTRVWELLVGAVSAFYLLKADCKKNLYGILNDICGWVGISLVFVSIITYGKQTPFPGFFALLPTVGSALIILFADKGNSVGKFLGNKLFVWFGLISYSAYLWHQPLFAFARHASRSEPDVAVFISLSLTVFVLSFFTWKYIESPFRSRHLFKRNHIFISSIAGMVFFIAIGSFAIVSNGFESRLDAGQRAILSFSNYKSQEVYRQGDCFLNFDQSYKDFKDFCSSEDGEGSILVWGDSHAAAVSYGLRKEFEKVSQYTAGGCPPILGVRIRLSPMCEEINDFVSQEISRKMPDTILIHSNWLLVNDNMEISKLANTIKYIKERSPRSNVVILGGVPQYSPSLPVYMIARHARLLDGAEVLAPNFTKISQLDEQLKSISAEFGAIFFSSLNAFCDAGSCLVAVSHDGFPMPTAWDYGHLTSAGSVFLARKINSLYKQRAH